MLRKKGERRMDGDESIAGPGRRHREKDEAQEGNARRAGEVGAEQGDGLEYRGYLGWQVSIRG